MKKYGRFIWAVVKGFGYCAAVVQIVLGIVYMGSNFMTVPQFQETTRYLEMAKTLVIDEYSGMLYPLFLRVCSQIPSIPFQIPIYVIQILLGLWAAYRFAYVWLEQKSKAVLCSLAINTIPFLAQAHVTVLPNSLVCSFFLLFFSVLFEKSRKRMPLSIMDMILCMSCYLLICQIGSAYFLPATGLLVWILCLQCYEKVHKALTVGVTLLISVGVVISTTGLYQATQTQGAYGRIQHSFQSAFFQRVGMSTLEERFMIYMPEEISQTFTGEQLEAYAKYPYQLQEEFGPILEAKYGREYTNTLYWRLGLLGFGNATKKTLFEIAEDVEGYVFPADSYFSWRNGSVRGMTSWNYHQFIQKTPRLATAYMKISAYTWLVEMGISVILTGVHVVRTKKLYLRVWGSVFVYLLYYACCFAAQGANIYDYKLALLPLTLNYICALYGILRKGKI